MRLLNFVLLMCAMAVALSGCALFQTSEPIDVKIAEQLVTNAEQIQKDTYSMVDLLNLALAGDESWKNDWNTIEGESRKMVTDANLELAKEALSNAEAVNQEPE